MLRIVTHQCLGGPMSMFKPEFIPRILLSLILFGLGSSLLIFGNPGCLCPLELVGQPHPPPAIYPIWKILTMCPFSVSNVSPSFRNFSSASFNVKWLPKVAMTTARLFFFPPSRTTVFLNPSARPYAIPYPTVKVEGNLLYDYRTSLHPELEKVRTWAIVFERTRQCRFQRQEEKE